MQKPAPGPNDLITDVEGLAVGNAGDHAALTGVTVVLPERPVVAGVDVRGGAPGTRDIEALDPSTLVEAIHGVVLAGGSVFGLDAAGGVIEWLAARGVGFTFGTQPLPCPVVPSAILFDLMNGGDKRWTSSPYRRLGQEAAAAAGRTFRLGNAGAGLGATAGIFKGGLGSASLTWRGMTVGALVAVNSYGSPADPATGALWAETLLPEGDRPRHPPAPEADALFGWTKAARGSEAGANTTIAVVATDAALTRSEARRLAIMAADGMARALRPIHTPFDGDTVFALATGSQPMPKARALTLAALGTLAADALARAIAKGVLAAEGIAGWPAFRTRAAPFA
ncbi:MAG: P1 family peptidase [Parvibaculaceae bacterium]